MTQQKLNEALGLAIISLGHVMVTDGVDAETAWSKKYELNHVRYLADHEIPQETITELCKYTAQELFRRC